MEVFITLNWKKLGLNTWVHFVSMPLVCIHVFFSINFLYTWGLISQGARLSFKFPIKSPPLGIWLQMILSIYSIQMSCMLVVNFQFKQECFVVLAWKYGQKPYQIYASWVFVLPYDYKFPCMDYTDYSN